MGDSLETLKKLAAQVRNAKNEGENDAERVGRTLVGVLDFLETLDATYLSKICDDNASGLITFLQGLTSLGKSYISSLTSDEANIKQLNAFIKDYLSSEIFESGLFGSGMRITKLPNGDWDLEIDTLTVRKIFTVFELVISKMRSINGGLVISSGSGKVKEVVTNDTYHIITIEGDMTFVVNDIVRCQQFGSAAKSYIAAITEVNGNTISILKSECASLPAVGDELVQFGNTTNTDRQSLIAMDLTGGKPCIQVLTEVNAINYVKNGWEITDGHIKHLKTGLELTSDGKLVAPADKFSIVGKDGKPIAVFDSTGDTPKIKAELIDVSTLTVGAIYSKDGNFQTLPDGTVVGVNSVFKNGKFSGMIQFGTANTGSIDSASLYYLPSTPSDTYLNMPWGPEQCGKVIKLYNATPLTGPNYYIRVCAFGYRPGPPIVTDNTIGDKDGAKYYVTIMPQETVELTCYQLIPKAFGSVYDLCYQWIPTSRFTIETHTMVGGLWYNKQSDGWLECGGVFSGAGDSTHIINIPAQGGFKDTSYYALAAKRSSDGKNQFLNGLMIYPYSRTQLKLEIQDYAGTWNWYACGKWK